MILRGLKVAAENLEMVDQADVYDDCQKVGMGCDWWVPVSN